MSNSSVLNSVRNFLASYHMFVDSDWLSGCVEFLTEDTTNHYSVEQIQNLAKEQWLLNDLKDICPGSLPLNLANQSKTVLNDRYVLQINSAIDIGMPAYQQYLKLQRVNTENLEATVKYEDKISSRRMIKLCLTDGAQDITAIEYRPMRNLNCDLAPGCKVLIKGPVECRRGMLLLTESSIELLGGEAQELADTHCLAALLSSRLGLPITQEPDTNTTIKHPRVVDIPTPHTEMPSARAEQNFNPAFDQNPRPVARVTSVQVADNIIDDDFDYGQLDSIEAELTNSSDSIKDNNKRSLNDLNTQPEKKPKIETVNRADDYPNDNELFDEEDDEYLRELEAKLDAKELKLKGEGPITISAEPFTFIKQINSMSDSDKAGRVFKVKAQIIKLLSKLSVSKDGWSLRCTIVDGTGSLDVDFTSNVLSKLIGFTPQEINKLKALMGEKPDVKEKVVEALKKAKDTLQVLYCIIELTILEVPKITNLTPFTDDHLQLLKNRTQDCAL